MADREHCEAAHGPGDVGGELMLEYVHVRKSVEACIISPRSEPDFESWKSAHPDYTPNAAQAECLGTCHKPLRQG